MSEGGEEGSGEDSEQPSEPREDGSASEPSKEDGSESNREMTADEYLANICKDDPNTRSASPCSCSQESECSGDDCDYLHSRPYVPRAFRERRGAIDWDDHDGPELY